MRLINTIALIPFFVLLFSCNGERKRDTGTLIESGPIRWERLEYAKRFRLAREKDYTLLEVVRPWPGAVDTLRYCLYRDQPPVFMEKPRTQMIQLPVERIVCFSTTHLPFLDMLGAENLLTGFPTTDYIYSKVFRERVKKGLIRDLGPSNEINFENLVALDPDMVMAFSMGNDLSIIRKIELSGIPVILNADYMEKHPLGRAEWIKFIAAFLGKEQKADSIFGRIKGAYLNTTQRVDQIEERPTVITGVVYGDTWFMPGGNHYGSVFFRDAGADYLWAVNPSSETLQLSFERVYEKAASVDYWVGVATYGSLREIRQADERYAGFRAFREGQVYNYTARTLPSGGNAYFEEGYARPDLILKDLVKIFHPGLMEDHKFCFYEKLY